MSDDVRRRWPVDEWDDGPTWADLLERPEWHRFAACRGAGAAFWYPERGESTRPAKLICSTCPVKGPCGEAGMREKFGIWGQRSERERRQLRREHRKEAA